MTVELEQFMTLDESRVQALQLPQEERELLGVALLTSLETAENQADVDAAWAHEIQARSEEYHSGRVVALDAAETIERIRQRVAARHVQSVKSASSADRSFGPQISQMDADS